MTSTGSQEAGDVGAGGVEVRLYTADDTATPVAATTTASNGAYLFENLRPGDYVVEFVAPDGTALTPVVDAGTDDAVDSDADPASARTGPVTLEAGEARRDVDAGLARLGSIGDTAFDDLDGDGVQDPGEPGVSGVAVELYRADDLGTRIAASVADDDGTYLFEGLLPGDYVVEFVPGTDLLLTASDAGDDDALDSDADPTTGRTSTIALGPAQDDVTVDAGIRRIAELVVTKVVDGSLVEGEEATYLVAVRNDGPNPVLGTITVVDDVPAGLAWTGAAGHAWSCITVDGDVVCTREGGLDVGGELELELTFDVLAATGHAVQNTVSVFGDGVVGPDGEPASSGRTPPTTVLAADLAQAGEAAVPWLLAVALAFIALGARLRRPPRVESG